MVCLQDPLPSWHPDLESGGRTPADVGESWGHRPSWPLYSLPLPLPYGHYIPQFTQVRHLQK